MYYIGVGPGTNLKADKNSFHQIYAVVDDILVKFIKL